MRYGGPLILFLIPRSQFSLTPRRHHKFPPQMKVPDTIRINDLTLVAKLKDGTQWSTPTLQPVKLSLSIAHDIRTSGELDDIDHTLNYASVVDTLTESSNGGAFDSLEALTDSIFKQCFETYPQIQSLSVKATKPKALLRGESVSLHVSRMRDSPSNAQESFSLEDVQFPVLIGVNPEERTTKQTILMSLTLSGRPSSSPVDYRLLAKQIYEVSGPIITKFLELTFDLVSMAIPRLFSPSKHTQLPWLATFSSRIKRDGRRSMFEWQNPMRWPWPVLQKSRLRAILPTIHPYL